MRHQCMILPNYSLAFFQFFSFIFPVVTFGNITMIKKIKLFYAHASYSKSIEFQIIFKFTRVLYIRLDIEMVAIFRQQYFFTVGVTGSSFSTSCGRSDYVSTTHLFQHEFQ